MKRVGKAKNRILILIMIIMLLLLSGCSTFDAFKEAFVDDPKPEAIKIVVFEPLTGKYNVEGNLEKIGIEIAHSIHPTVIGREVELVYIDSQSDITAIKDELVKLSSDTQTAIIGSYGEVYTLYLGQKVLEIKVPAITPTSTSNLITKDNEYFFTTAYTSENIGSSLAKYAYMVKNFTKSAVIKIKEDDSTNEIREQYINEFNELTGSKFVIAEEYQILLDDTDFTDLLNELKANEVKSIFVPISNNVVLEMMREAQVIDYYPLFLGTKQMATDSSFLSAVSQYGANLAYCDEDVNTSNSELGKAFVDIYHNTVDYESEPSQATALAFDSYMILMEAITNAYGEVFSLSLEDYLKDVTDDSERMKLEAAYNETKSSGIPTALLIKNAILKIEDYNGVSGNITYGGSNVAAKSIVIKYISGNVSTNLN